MKKPKPIGDDCAGFKVPADAPQTFNSKLAQIFAAQFVGEELKRLLLTLAAE